MISLIQGSFLCFFIEHPYSIWALHIPQSAQEGNIRPESCKHHQKSWLSILFLSPPSNVVSSLQYSMKFSLKIGRAVIQGCCKLFSSKVKPLPNSCDNSRDSCQSCNTERCHFALLFLYVLCISNPQWFQGGDHLAGLTRSKNSGVIIMRAEWDAANSSMAKFKSHLSKVAESANLLC